ncbi:MAG TPA: hotdog domain-containing protein [Trebonia sp.]|nr:hotdog domain-containing protein [Trebonia sp.]
MSVSEDDLATRHKRHMLTELHFNVRPELAESGQLTGEAELTPFMHVPGTANLRTSILVMWADMLGGILSLVALRPAVPVTLELDIHLYHPAPADGRLTAVGRTVKAGRSVHVVESQFMEASGRVFAFSTGSFMASPNTSLTAPSGRTSMRWVTDAPALAMPLGERAGLSCLERGVAQLPMTDEGLNSSNTMHGGLIGMVAEEAALSLAPPGSTLSSLGIRYLSPVRSGPAVATAAGAGGLYRAEIRDVGAASRLAALATARTF